MEAVRRVTRAAGELGIDFLTLYAFSLENWNRPRSEVHELMRLLDSYLEREIDGLMNSMSDSGSVKSEVSGHTMKRYEIPGADSDLATIFETVEAKKGELGIVDFSVSQTSLEDVFIKFARLQG